MASSLVVQTMPVDRDVAVLKLRLAIISVFFSALIPVLILNLTDGGLYPLVVNFAPFAAAFAFTILATLVLPFRRKLDWLSVEFVSDRIFIVLGTYLYY